MKITKIDKETNRVSASVKALTEDPYENIDKKYKISDEKICNPYGQGDASGQIITLLKDIQESTFKSFYDLNVGDIK